MSVKGNVNMDKSINIIIPYFGEFPNYFQLFLNSCWRNSTVNWTIITDNTKVYRYPENVRVIQMTFGEIKERIQQKFDFEVVVPNAHKLCEYKPAYAYIFPELVEDYDFWGYGDIDLIYGDIRKFVTDDLLSQYDKIFTLGHLTLVKNSKKNNELFMEAVDNVSLFRQAFSSPQNYNFDEQFGNKPNINTIFINQGYKVWTTSYAADIYTKSSDFRLDMGDGSAEDKKTAVFVWNNGKIYRYICDGQKILEQEYLYIHLQKRKMNVCVDEDQSVIKIIPNEFTNLEIPIDNVRKDFKKIKKKNCNLQYFRIRYKNLKVKLKSKFR